MLHIRQLWIEPIIFFSCLLIFISCSRVQVAASADNKNDYYFKSLQAKLISDGFDKARIKKLYSEPRVSFNTKGVSSYFVHSESKLNYGQFLKKSPIRKARRYMKIHKTDLTAAEKAYGVNRRIITAIMLVETRLGTYTGKSSVFNILSTMAALESPKVKAILWKKISNSTHLTNEDFEKKAEKKSGWAYDELKAFLKYTAGEKINPLDIYGSYAGAMGICQFMPSNILTLARDGNNDGRINLFNHADAIMSIASYLNYYGWYPGIDSKKAYEVVYEYNHSQYYVNTILKIAELLKGQS